MDTPHLKNILPRSGAVGGVGDCGSHAIANAKAWQGSVTPTSPKVWIKIQDIETEFASKFTPAGTTADQAKQILGIKLRAAGPGSQAIVRVIAPGNKPGHVFNAFNVDGAPRFLDTSSTASHGFFEGGVAFDIMIIP